MLVQGWSWHQREHGRRSGSGLRSRPCGESGDEHFRGRRPVADRGYLVQKRSKHDGRVIFVRPTQKSRSLCRQLVKIHQQQLKLLQERTINKKEIQQMILSL